MEFIFSQPVQIQAMVMFVVVWGLFTGVKTSILHIVCMFVDDGVAQNELGRLIQCAWYVCIASLFAYYIF